VKIGYPCINLTVKCNTPKTFRLRSYSPKRLVEAVSNNLQCLKDILHYNVQHDIRFFRISSDLIPFASHRINRYNWQEKFKSYFQTLGSLIKTEHIRISMHPDQFTLINSIDRSILSASVRELMYHADILDLMKLPFSAKIQIHVGGVYENKQKSIQRFVRRYHRLNPRIQRRLVIENDDRSYTVADCLEIHHYTGIPVLFDVFHDQVNPSGMDLKTALGYTARTWRKNDGIPMIDYSVQKRNGRTGQHADHIHIKKFKQFLLDSFPFDFDVMLEIKDKERSALKALRAAREDTRVRKLVIRDS
jgi:UV DNA damage endonuclease